MKKILPILNVIIDGFRLFLGPPGCCIYPITCRQYAKYMLKNKPFYISLPLICLRLLSCNPITSLVLKLKFKYHSKISKH